jgi:site-specific DNA-methyltransferase (cytosine-N4-specific)
MNWLNKCHFGDCIETMRAMPDGIVQTCVTSPPYFGLRSYLPDGVRLKASLPADVRAAVIAELQQFGIHPLSLTSD